MLAQTTQAARLSAHDTTGRRPFSLRDATTDHISEATWVALSLKQRITNLRPTNTRRSAERASAEVHEGAMCVQRLDDSLNSAIRITYRSSLRSSSKHEPRGPPLEVMLHKLFQKQAPRELCSSNDTTRALQ